MRRLPHPHHMLQTNTDIISIYITSISLDGARAHIPGLGALREQNKEKRRSGDPMSQISETALKYSSLKEENHNPSRNVSKRLSEDEFV